MSVAIKVEGHVSRRLFLPHVTIELFLKDDVVSEPKHTHAFSRFTPDDAGPGPTWSHNFKKLQPDSWYYVITTYRSGGANGVTVNRTLSANKTGTRA